MHLILDVIGIVDPTGLADLSNAAIYVLEDRPIEAALSAASAIPFGDFVKVGKYGVKASKTLTKEAVTGARILDRVPSKKAEEIYHWIRGLNPETNIKTVARNTGLPEWYIAKIRQHIFFEEHLLTDATGKMVRRRFDADEMIATWWKAASTGGIPKAELERVRLLFAHEYVEHALMRSGQPYRRFGKSGNELPDSAHRWAPKVPEPGPGGPLYMPGDGPWKHWDK